MVIIGQGGYLVDGDLASPVSIAQPSVHAIACLTGEDGHASTCHELGHFVMFTPLDFETKHDFNSIHENFTNSGGKMPNGACRLPRGTDL